MTVREACEQYGLAAKTLREMLSSGLLFGEKIEGQWHLDAKELENFLDFSTRWYQKCRARHAARTEDRQNAEGIACLQQFLQKVQDKAQPARPSWRGSTQWAPSRPGVDNDNERNRYGWD